MKHGVEVLVNISQDYMKASVVYGLRGGSLVAPSREDILSALQNAGVVHGIREEALAAAQDALPGESVPVAKGKPPVPGQDAELVFRFNTFDHRPLIKEDGTVDYKELNLVKNVTLGQTLVERIPPGPGIPGVDVRGRVLPGKTGRDKKLPAGPGTRETPDGRLVAACDGHVYMKDEKVCVNDTYVIPGNVDVSTGNIRAIGNVLIKGNVQEGYEVDAGGAITVMGRLEGGTLLSGGNITVQQGVQGRYRSVIHCGGNFSSRFIENLSQMEVRENILVEKHILHSQIACHKRIRLYGKPGHIMGGQIKVILSLEADHIGNENYTRTTVELGDFTALPILERIDQLKQEIYDLELAVGPARRAVEELKTLTGRNDALARKRMEELGPLVETFRKLYPDLKARRDEKLRLESELKPIEEEQFIQATGSVHPGVVFKGDGHEFAVRRIVKAQRWRLTPHGWRARPAARRGTLDLDTLSQKEKEEQP